MNTVKASEEYLEAVLAGNKVRCHQLIRSAISAKVPVIDIYHQILYPVMVQIGELWQENKISVAQEHLATAITQNIISSHYPTLLQSIESREKERGKVLVACPGSELHELGARMLSDIWELEGWDVTYLGSNIPPHFIAEALGRGDYTALGLSCSLSFNVRFVRETIEKVRAVRQFKGVVIVGGRIFNVDAALLPYVGGDCYGKNFYEAVKILEKINGSKGKDPCHGH